MPYRDESEALRAQLAEAQHALEELRRENLALRTPAPASERSSLLAGGPLRLQLSTTVAGELAPADHDAILDAVGESHERMQGQTVGRRLEIRVGAYEGRDIVVRISAKNGSTTIIVRERHYALLGGVFGGGLGGIGGGGLGGVIPVAVLLTESAPITTAAAFGWLLGAFGVARVVYGRIAARREHEAQLLMRSIEEAVRAQIELRRTKARVEVGAGGAEADDRGERESEALGAQQARARQRRP